MKSLIIILMSSFFVLSLQSQSQIEKIEFLRRGHGASADYEMSIYSNRTMIYNARENNYKFPYNGDEEPLKRDGIGSGGLEPEIKGLFMTDLNKKLFKEINSLILSLDKEFKQKKYSENSLHVSTAYLKVTFQNNTVHSVYDYGMKGSDKLIKLYALLDDLRFNQVWK